MEITIFLKTKTKILEINSQKIIIQKILLKIINLKKEILILEIISLTQEIEILTIEKLILIKEETIILLMAKEENLEVIIHSIDLNKTLITLTISLKEEEMTDLEAVIDLIEMTISLKEEEMIDSEEVIDLIEMIISLKEEEMTFQEILNVMIGLKKEETIFQEI